MLSWLVESLVLGPGIEVKPPLAFCGPRLSKLDFSMKSVEPPWSHLMFATLIPLFFGLCEVVRRSTRQTSWEGI